MSASHPSDSEEIRQQVRSREGHSVEALTARLRSYRRNIRQLQQACAIRESRVQRVNDAARRESIASNELRVLLRQANDIIKNTKPYEACPRLHVDVSILAYTLLLLTCGVAGYLLGILRHVR